MRKFDLRINSRHALTWGFDGFIIGRCNKFEKEIGMVLPHHMFNGGVKKAYMDISGKFIISLGRDEILTCTDLVENVLDLPMITKSFLKLESPSVNIMFRRRTILDIESKVPNKQLYFLWGVIAMTMSKSEVIFQLCACMYSL